MATKKTKSRKSGKVKVGQLQKPAKKLKAKELKSVKGGGADGRKHKMLVSP